jgi:hypothetical protein
MLIQVAVVMLAVISMTAWVFDYGVLWISRTQIQTAADAAALAGAAAIAYDSPGDVAAAKTAAVAMAPHNPVWSVAPEVLPTDVLVDTCGTLAPESPNGSATCVQVDAYRGAEDATTGAPRGQDIPTYLSGVFGLTSQGVRARAIAEVMPSDTANCLRPWSIPDRWTENQTGPWSTDDTFDKYAGKGKKGGLLPKPDVYVAPGGANGAGTGFTIADVGLQMVLKEGTPQSAIAPGWYNPIDLPRKSGPTKGGAKYQENIETCNSLPVSVDDWLQTEPGNMIGPTKHGVEALIAQDPGASWNPTTKKVEGSCCALSPRVVPIALYNPDVYADGQQNGRTEIQVSNIVGFFVDSLNGNDVIGYLTVYPGQGRANVELPNESAFLRSIVLTR